MIPASLVSQKQKTCGTGLVHVENEFAYLVFISYVNSSNYVALIINHSKTVSIWPPQYCDARHTF